MAITACKMMSQMRQLCLRLQSVSLSGPRRCLHADRTGQVASVTAARLHPSFCCKGGMPIGYTGNQRVNQSAAILPHNLLSLSPVVSVNQTKIDISPGPSVSYDCPNNSKTNREIDIPPVNLRILPIECPVSDKPGKAWPGTRQPGKQASRILKIRRRKMKKHRLAKKRFKYLSQLRTERYLRSKKKIERFQQVLNKLESYGTKFDAKAYIEDQLQLAREGGYRVNVFKSK